MNVRELVDKLVENPNHKLKIRGQVKEIVGFAEFRTVNLGEDGYYKLTFDDHSFLLITPGDGVVMYTDEAPAPYSEIAGEDIGAKKELIFREREYVLDNPHDYQYVVRLIKGGPEEIEGEVKFSDYVPKDGSAELLSLGWIVRTGSRADVNPREIDVSEIEVV